MRAVSFTPLPLQFCTHMDSEPHWSRQGGWKNRVLVHGILCLYRSCMHVPIQHTRVHTEADARTHTFAPPWVLARLPSLLVGAGAQRWRHSDDDMAPPPQPRGLEREGGKTDQHEGTLLQRQLLDVRTKTVAVRTRPRTLLAGCVLALAVGCPCNLVNASCLVVGWAERLLQLLVG